jgi:tellurite resistance protein
MSHHPTPLKFLFPGWYAIVMGLCGLALAWHRAVPLMGEAAGVVSVGVGFAGGGGVRRAGGGHAAARPAPPRGLGRGPQAPRAPHLHRHAADRHDPAGHGGGGARAQGLASEALWAAGALAQLWVTAWVLGRWWKGNGAGGLVLASATPALFIPIVGNVLVPLAGVPLGHVEWSAAQFGVGLLFWPVVMILIGVRIATSGLWPDRLRPTSFIFIAPPAVVGLSALQFGAPVLVGWALWGMAMFSLAWVGLQAKAIAALPFGLPHWGLSFPLAALAALTLRLAGPGGPMATLGLLLLALASLVILALLLGTVRGLRDGSLLAPEPVAAIQPVAAA